ncbi:hypothetical protein, partial [Streptomyces gardneri]|uniref:hypothetical protein n=1 Tax=Streptomyces gardneri TaxID=66892 RepID=UPI0035DAC9F8
FFYNESNGACAGGRFDTNANFTGLTTGGGLSKNWSHIVAVGRELFFYNESNGACAGGRFDTNANFTGLTTGGGLSTNWTKIVAMPASSVPEEVSFAVSECDFAWTARYLQDDTHVTVRILLNPDAGITSATMNTLRTTWHTGIVGKWSNRFDCIGPNGQRQPITFDVQWVTSNPHHVVRVRPGPAATNMGNWDTSDSGDVASHEFGHMLGHPDEYADTDCPMRNPINTGTVMDDNTESVARHYSRITQLHGGHAPAAHAPEPPEPTREAVVGQRLIDRLKPELRASILRRLRDVADAKTVSRSASETEVSFAIRGGAPGERYTYRISVRGDGGAERLADNEAKPGTPIQVTKSLDRELVAQVFSAAAAVGLLDDEAPRLPDAQDEILPDSMIATITVREGDSIRRISVPAEEPATAESLPGEPENVPLDTHVQLPARSVAVLQPVLQAFAAIESRL